ncbi:MAG: DNA adenine methylase [Myxococcota bacterium]
MKWVGGKGRILPQLLPLLPPGAELMRHVEPFVGGGAMFFARRPERALLSDVNPDLVATYETVRDRVEAVIEALVPLARDHSKEHYYRARDRYNRNRGLTHAERAALFIYLNKTCFNGLYRVNRKGEFNVPAGRYKNPRVLDEDMLRSASAALQHADIRCQGFEELLEAARPGDFIYFDPPYAPLSPTANFTGYASGGFDRDDQRRLHEVFRELDRRGCRMMLSNSDVPFVRYLYRAWRIDVVAAPRAVSCNGRGRGKVTEVVVRNY